VGVEGNILVGAIENGVGILPEEAQRAAVSPPALI